MNGAPLSRDVLLTAVRGPERFWVNYAFGEIEKCGYTVASAYTAVKNKARTKFVYRDRLWADYLQKLSAANASRDPEQALASSKEDAGKGHCR